MSVSIKTYNQILGDMIRKIIADTPLNDINTGSVLLTLLEAASTSDFENNVAILNVLELLNLDVLKNVDLDNRAADFGLVRTPAIKASGFVTISDTTITKISTGLYPVKPAPIKGSTVLYVNDASAWALTGTLYIGRGTSSFEGPIPYTGITNFGTFFAIQLGSSLQKDHLISDSVVDGQGTTDRLIPSGTIIKIPANNQNPEILYTTLRDAVIPAGEDNVGSVSILALKPGSIANASINTIVSFNSPPFTGAAVTNTNALTNGTDVEGDESLRERIKSYAQTLARGTKQAILAGLVGISDPSDGKQVASAVITEPVRTSDPSIIYIDDGSGFQPTYQGQSVDALLTNAKGNEEFFQLANYPLPRPQVVNTADGPYQLEDGMTFRVLVDNDEETINFSVSQFTNISAATLPEIVVAINDQSTLFKTRLTADSSRLLIYPVAFDAEIIQVGPLRSTDLEEFYANRILKFPTNQFSYIALFKNKNTRLREQLKSATLITSPYGTWNVTSSSNIVISVDGTPEQDRTFDSTDFGGVSFAALTLDNWVAAFNAKFAGVNAVATSGGSMRLTSNKSGAASKLEVLGGTLLSKLFPDLPVLSQGQDPDFQLSRQTGNLRILGKFAVGDSLDAGTDDAKGSVVSLPTTTGNYNVSADSNARPAEAVVVVDANRVLPRVLTIAVGSTMTITDQGSHVMRIMSSSSAAFKAVQPFDYIYITNRGDINGLGTGTWLDVKDCGIYQVVDKGPHNSDGVDTYVEVKNDDIVAGGPYTVQAGEDVQAFLSDKYPQLWKGTFLNNPPASSLQEVVDSFNNELVGVKASIFKSNSVKLTSSEEDGGSIAIPVSVGNAKILFLGATTEQKGNPSMIANRQNGKDLVTYFKRTTPTNSNVFLGRYTYTDVKGSLSADAVPGIEGTDPYSEQLQSSGVLNSSNVEFKDLVSITKGNNKQVYRSIKSILPADTIGTQFANPKTIMDHTAGDQFEIVRSLELSSEDSIVTIIDNDPIVKTVDIPIARTGKVNSGSQSISFTPTSTAFSADDADNEPGIDFGTPQVWSTTLNNTEFKDYAVWMRARNWYASGGVGAGKGTMLVRSFQYGPTGQNTKFLIDYPQTSDQLNLTTFINSPTGLEFKYFFGSGAARTTNISAISTFAVTSLGSYNFRYTFSADVDLSTILVGDVFSALNDSGISTNNRGQFRVNAVNAGTRTIDIYNPNGSITAPGNPEITSVTTVADVAGAAAANNVTTVADVAGSLDGTYFVLYDSAGSVAVWFDVDNNGTPQPSAGTARYIKIATVITGDSANTVATKIAQYLALDAEFTASVLGNVVSVTNTIKKARPTGTAGTSGFTVLQTAPGSDPVSLDDTYFILHDLNGSVAFWFDVDNNGTPEPIHGADRSVRIGSVNTGDSANTVAGRVSAAVNADTKFVASVLGNVVTVTDAFNGDRPTPSAGTTGFTVVTMTNGTSTAPESVTIPTSVIMFPLVSTSVASIATKVNATDIVKLVAVGNDALNIDRATREEVYTIAGPITAPLSFGHDPNPLSGNSGQINLYDSKAWVQVFQNSNPNFSIKNSLVLVGAAPTVYAMNTCPNDGTATLGEFFKLIPTTINNVEHHLTQKALSQLPIISDVDIVNNDRRIQVKSKLLGSVGAVEVVGGRANAASFKLVGDSQEISSGGNYLELKISAFPDTINVGDTVKLSNPTGVKRFSRLSSADSMKVVKISSGVFEYRYQPKETNLNKYVKFAITDASAMYSKPAGTIWRWTHNDAGSLFDITSATVGTVGVQPKDEIAAGITDAANLSENIIDAGSVSTALHFQLTVSAMPSQADYFTFRNPAGVTFAAWFDIDGAGTPPTGASYTGAANQIIVSILSTDTPNEIMNKLSSALGLNVNFNAAFNSSQLQGATLQDVNAGDLVSAYGTLTGWSAGNKALQNGDGRVAGLPIISVDTSAMHFDVLNPHGRSMSSTFIGSGNVVQINPTPIIKWNLKHAAKVKVIQILVSGGVATATVDGAHQLNVGDTFAIADSSVVPTVPGTGIGTVTAVQDYNSFSFATSTVNGTYSGGNIINSSKTVTRYRIESLSFNNMFRLSRYDGESPGFADCGVAVDDYLVLGGDSFKSNNSGRFRVLAVDNDALIYINENGKEELNTVVPFNNSGVNVTWTSSSNVVTGIAGSFENVNVGDWVKKPGDDDSLYRQIQGLNTGVPSTATIVTLGSSYGGASGTDLGIKFDQVNDVNKGVRLLNVDDISIYEGDAVVAGDVLFIQNIINSSWFNISNTGTFGVREIGFSSDYSPFLRVNNLVGVAQTGIALSVNTAGLSITENLSDKFYTIRKVQHIGIDELNDQRRVMFLTPSDRAYKFSESNKSIIESVGKLGYSTDVTTGVDGYLYYIGLLRTVQRVIDGFDPDQENFPGRRAIGGVIEILPPLIKRITIAVNVTTDEGVNLGEISNQIKSTAIDYIFNLGVGQDVILSEIIARIMNIKGVAAVTFITPSPSTERVSIAENEKAFIESKDISVA